MTAIRGIKIRHRDGTMLSVKAAPTPTPGLFVNQDPAMPELWDITHLASGALVARLDSPEAALDAAIKLGPVCDWTASGADLLNRMPDIRRRGARVLGGMEPLS